MAESRLKRGKSPEADPSQLASITALNDQIIAEALREGDYSSGLSLLEQLQSQLKTQPGVYSSSRKHSHYHLFVCWHNTAVVYQATEDSPKARDALNKAIKHYQQVQGFITNRQENLVFNVQLAELQLQLCGLLSHCAQHNEAAALAEKSLDKVIQTARILEAVCYEQSLLHSQQDTTCSSRQKNTRSEYVNFKRVVIEEAEPTLHLLAQLNPADRLLALEKDYFVTVIKKVFAWKENEGNNETALRRELGLKPELNTKPARSLLGLQKEYVQEEQFKINSLTSLSFKQLSYSPHPDPLRLLSLRHLRHLAFLAAVSYFMAATESRFGAPDLREMQEKLPIDQKYYKLNHDERLLRCKILHLKAIEVAGRLLPSPSSNVLFGHLVQSFTRNYKFVMDEIDEVSEVNSTHVTFKQESLHNEYGFKMRPPKKEDSRKGEQPNRMKTGKHIKGKERSKSQRRSCSTRKTQN